MTRDRRKERGRTPPRRFSAEKLRALHHVMDAAPAGQMPDAFLREMTLRIRDVFDSDSATVLLLSAKGDELVIAASSGIEEEGAGDVRVPLGRGIAGRIAATGEATVIEDIAKIEVMSRPLREKIRSIAGVPLVARERVIGVILVGTIEKRHFGADDLDLLGLIAGRISGAIEMAKLVEELQQESAEQEATIAAIEDGLLIYDRAGNLLHANDPAIEMLGDSREDLARPAQGRWSRLQVETTDGRVLPQDEWPIGHALKGERVKGRILVLRRHDRVRWVSVSAAPIRGKSGDLTGAVATIADVTQLHDLEEQREDLLRAVSHDMRNPLMAIVGKVDYLKRAAAQQGLGWGASIESIAEGVRAIDSMIQLLVESSRLRAGTVQLERRPVFLAPFVRDVVRRSAGPIDPDRIHLEIPADLPQVLADPGGLERILLNLLTNASKFADPGSSIRLRAEGRAEAKEVEISVIDSGIGIAEDELPRIFDRFYRARGSERCEGLGLGLYIVRKLVERHGGRIRVESEIGKGSVFYVTIPTAPPMGSGR